MKIEPGIQRDASVCDACGYTIQEYYVDSERRWIPEHHAVKDCIRYLRSLIEDTR